MHSDTDIAPHRSKPNANWKQKNSKIIALEEPSPCNRVLCTQQVKLVKLWMCVCVLYITLDRNPLKTPSKNYNLLWIIFALLVTQFASLTFTATIFSLRWYTSTLLFLILYGVLIISFLSLQPLALVITVYCLFLPYFVFVFGRSIHSVYIGVFFSLSFSPVYTGNKSHYIVCASILSLVLHSVFTLFAIFFRSLCYFLSFMFVSGISLYLLHFVVWNPLYPDSEDIKTVHMKCNDGRKRKTNKASARVRVRVTRIIVGHS